MVNRRFDESTRELKLHETLAVEESRKRLDWTQGYFGPNLFHSVRLS